MSTGNWTPSRVGDGVSLIVHLLCVAVPMAMGWWLVREFAPPPVSDFAAYWSAAVDPSRYTKGGALVLLYAPLASAGVSPFVAAGLVNSLALLAMGRAFWVPVELRSLSLQFVSSAIMLLVALWSIGFFPLVNSDVPQIGFGALGMRFLLSESVSPTSPIVHSLLTILALGAALTIRIQTLGAVLATAFAFLMLVLVARVQLPRRIVLVMACAVTFSVLLEAGLRRASSHKDAISLHSRVTFYTGLFSTEVGEWCGGWTLEAANAARADLNRSFIDSARERLARRATGEWLELIGCKLRRYLAFERQGFDWIGVSLAMVRPSESELRSKALEFAAKEEPLGALIKWLTAALVLVAAAFGLRGPTFARLAGLLPLLLGTAFVSLHAVVEIQPRYLLEPVALCSLVAIYFLAALPRLRRVVSGPRTALAEPAAVGRARPPA